MNKYYTAYIHRGDDEIEVTAELYDHGQLEGGFESDVGYWSEVIEDPEFCEYTAFDDYGVELTLTLREIIDSETQMIKQYWDSYEDDRWGYGT